MKRPNNHKLINLWQSSEERRQKYWLALSCGANYGLACRMRDWRLSKIERFFNLANTYNPKTHAYDREMPTAKGNQLHLAPSTN